MARPLDEYNGRRNFVETPEPSGEREGTKQSKRKEKTHALQFCIQKHDASHLHYDFRLELDGTLKSWAIPKGPSLDPSVKRMAVHVEDHPIEYASFEGRIPQGHYGAGEVIVWDRGVWIAQGDPLMGYEKGRLKFELKGEKLTGVWNLVRMRKSGKQDQWLLIKHEDDSARSETEYDVLESQPDSVLSDRSIADTKTKSRAIAPKPTKKSSRSRNSAATDKEAPENDLQGAVKAALPESLKPELATLVESPPEGDWRYELKFDGYRILARVEAGRVSLFTRNGHDWTHKLPRQAEALTEMALPDAWLDGEVVVANEDGVPDFQALQNAFDRSDESNIVYYVFDLPYFNGQDLRKVALEQRRDVLAQLFEKQDSHVLMFSHSFDAPPSALLESACKMKMEGLIGKRSGSFYQSQRSHDWIKLKCKRRQEFVVVGFTEPKGTRSAFGALLLGLHDPDSGELKYAGRVGTGFNESTLRSVHKQLLALQTSSPSVSNPPVGAQVKDVHWLKPQLLAEVAFAQMTQEGLVRQAVFNGLRNDKPPSSITEEKAIPIQEVESSKARPTRKSHDTKSSETAQQSPRITHPDRIIDASTGTTKKQLADYYLRIAPWILPHLADRPVALVRAPDGLEGELFFQKNASHLAIPGITTEVHDGKGLMVIDNVQALLGAVQMNAIELHTWNAQLQNLDLPDRFILDLDPDPALPWRSMVEATHLTLTLLEELGLKSFLKTSGGKGIHIVVPLKPAADWDEVKRFSQGIVKHMAKLMPERFSAISGPKNRVGRIFIDYLRNSQGATTIAAFAARAREGMAVSMPIFKEEVAQIKSADAWTIHNVHLRLVDFDDPWKGFSRVRQQLTAKMFESLGVRQDA